MASLIAVFTVIAVATVASAVADLCSCTREYMPVCGTNLKTYNNKCLLKCAEKKHKNLTILHTGKCAHIAQRKMKPKSDKVRRCRCDLTVLKPVCGSDLQMYPTECVLKCVAKAKHKVITVVDHSKCDVRVKKS